MKVAMAKKTSQAFAQNVDLKFRIYNSLFLTLPFDLIHQTGTLLPLLSLLCERKYEEGKGPSAIIRQFFEESGQFAPDGRSQQIDILFNFVKYIERQVVLFDAIEEAAFSQVHDMTGPGTVEALFDRAAVTKSMDKLSQTLNDFQLRVVLTAHPTQFYPGHVLGIITDLAHAIRADDVEQINMLLLQLGKSPFINREKPTPFDEAVSLIWYLENVFYKSIPVIVDDVGRRLKDLGYALRIKDLIRMGFWPGGDRDGNPFVNCQITLETATRLRRAILTCYHRDIRNLRRRLTFRHVMSKVVDIDRKLFLAIQENEEGYQTDSQLLSDLRDVLQALHDHHQGLFSDILESFITRVEIFGFYFATLDIRQDSSKHREVIAHLINRHRTADKADAFFTMEDSDRVDFLLAQEWHVDTSQLSDEVHKDVIESFPTIEKIGTLNGERACHRYIISNTQNATDIFSVYCLAVWACGHTPDHLDIVPLFETIDDLQNAAEVMEYMYRHPVYAAHLEKRNNRQAIMLGFSDGTKDGGYLSANWSIFKAKEALTTISRHHNIDVIFFDGRGGPPARGGGNTHKFYSSLGSGIENKEVQLTIQGQTVSSNFGSYDAAVYNLEQLLSAGVENSVFKEDIADLTPAQHELLEEMAAISLESYSDLKNHPLFLSYLEDLGTLQYYGETNIGSRPVKRGQGQALTLDSLRAIPFVGSWSQMKQNVPGFYGFGTAIDTLSREDRIDEVKALYRHSRFFQTLVGNSMQSLCKSYFPLTAHLENHEKYGDIWRDIHEEYKSSVSRLLEISGQEELLEETPNIRESIRLREHIVLPLLTIQQHVLDQIRHADELSLTDTQVGLYRKLVTRTMFGIINAGRNSA